MEAHRPETNMWGGGMTSAKKKPCETKPKSARPSAANTITEHGVHGKERRKSLMRRRRRRRAGMTQICLPQEESEMFTGKQKGSG